MNINIESNKSQLINKNITKTLNLYSDNDSSEKSEDLDQEEDIFSSNRTSLKKALHEGNYYHAFEKVNSNITSFCSSIQELQDYFFKEGSKLDSNEKGDKISTLIESTANDITETFFLIKDIKDFNFTRKNDKIQNITKANELEIKCNKYKKMFDDLTEKIRKQNLTLIKQARSSLHYSNYSDFSRDLNFSSDGSEKNLNNKNFKNGNEFLDGIEVKKKQNDTIYEVTRKIQRKLSKLNTNCYSSSSIQKRNASCLGINKDFFNGKNNELKKKYSMTLNNDDDINSNYLIKNSGDIGEIKRKEQALYEMEDKGSLAIRTSTAFHEMEDKVLTALEDRNSNWCLKNWKCIGYLLCIIFIGVLVYYFFYAKKK